MTTISNFMSALATLAPLGALLVWTSYVAFAMFFPPLHSTGSREHDNVWRGCESWGVGVADLFALGRVAVCARQRCGGAANLNTRTQEPIVQRNLSSCN